MAAEQKRAVASDKPILVFHMEMRMTEEDDNDESKVQHTSLGPEWEELHSTIPVVKYPRVITAQDQGNGTFLFLCSCGFGTRYQCVCRHIAMILLHASEKSCAGCECENIALRNTAAFAACNDVSVIRRSANDWRGIMCSHVTEDSLKNCPSGDGDNDGDHGDQDGGDDQGARAAPKRRSSRQIEEESRWKQQRDNEMTKLQEHYFRVRSKLLSCKREDFFERVARVDTHIVAAFRELDDVEDVADSTVAHRYRDDPKRAQRPKTPSSKRAATPQSKRQAADGGSAAAAGGFAGTSTSAPAHASIYTVINISDSDDLQTLLNGGAPSDTD